MEQLIQRGTIDVFSGVQTPDKDMGFFSKKISEKNVVITPVLKTEKSLISFCYDCIALFFLLYFTQHCKMPLKVSLTEAKQKYITVYSKQNL